MSEWSDNRLSRHNTAQSLRRRLLRLRRKRMLPLRAGLLVLRQEQSRPLFLNEPHYFGSDGEYDDDAIM